MAELNKILNNKKQLSSHMFEDVYKKLNIDVNKLGCVMLDLEPLPDMRKSLISKSDLYISKHKDRFWVDGWIADKTAHVTLLYGLLKSGKEYEPYIKQVLNNWEIKEVEIDHVSYFDSQLPDEPYYCIIAHIKVTPNLIEGHQRLEFLPHISTFTGYKPHMTICYISKKSGIGFRDSVIKRFNKLWSGKKLKVNKEINLGSDKK